MVTLLTWQQVHDVVEQVVQLEVGQDIVEQKNGYNLQSKQQRRQ
jgi:hypothetical protein